MMNNDNGLKKFYNLVGFSLNPNEKPKTWPNSLIDAAYIYLGKHEGRAMTVKLSQMQTPKHQRFYYLRALEVFTVVRAA